MTFVPVGSGLLASGDLVLDASGYFLRTDRATVNFTSAEAKILAALVRGETSGACVHDIVFLLGHMVSERSIHVVQTQISKIRQKIMLIGNERISIQFDKRRQLYLLDVADLPPSSGIGASQP
jgi:DNA-binding response OmpR family regulator